jgi:lysophospholipase L1-like esterase
MNRLRMPPWGRAFARFVVLGALLAAPLLAEPPRSFERWEQEIAKIEQRDAKQPPAPGGVVFVGSSSIRLWDLEQSFPGIDAVNHGFGGSTIADSVHFVERLVLKFKPRTVVFYAGDNDLAGSKESPALTPQQLLHDFQAFTQAIHKELPETKVIFIPVKPSVARAKLLPQQMTANRLIREAIERDAQQRSDKSPRMVYLDIVSPMLDAQGKPRPELFIDDGLHLNAAGYALWNERLLPHLK